MRAVVYVGAQQSERHDGIGRLLQSLTIPSILMAVVEYAADLPAG